MIFRTWERKVFTEDGVQIALAVTESWAEKIVKALVQAHREEAVPVKKKAAVTSKAVKKPVTKKN